MKDKKHTQNQSDLRNCEERSDEAISKSKLDCHALAGFAMTRNTCVLLANFGGPDSVDSVKPFLYNLFCDPKIIKLPFPLRNFVAWIISSSRYKSSGEMYKKIGGISPLIPITYLQAEKLQKLFSVNNILLDVFVGFRYCKPFIQDVLTELKNKGYQKIVILPLYPQYSYTTTGSTELVINEWMKKNGLRHCEEAELDFGELSRTVEADEAITSPQIFFVKSWYKDEDYITAYANLINNACKHLDLRRTEIIFSAHSIPVSNIENGDPYENHIKETVDLIVKKLDWKKPWHIAYQSKIGPVKWLEPSCEFVIEEIAKKNPNINILVVPISFTCEHVETIYEIGILYKEIADKYGIKTFRRVPALNTDKFLIQALYNQTVNCLEDNKIDFKELFLVR